jgi:hypothetical protein
MRYFKHKRLESLYRTDDDIRTGKVSSSARVLLFTSSDRIRLLGDHFTELTRDEYEERLFLKRL